MWFFIILCQVIYAEINAMTWSRGQLLPSYDTAVTSYQIILPSSVDTINLACSVENDRYLAYVDLDPYPTQFLVDDQISMDFNLTFGDNVFTITDEHQAAYGPGDGTYTVTVTRVTYTPEPPADPTVQPCQNIYQLLVALISDQYENDYECATLSSAVFDYEEFNQGEVTTDLMCDCYVVSPRDLIYTYDCGLTSDQPYSINDMARMCNGDIGPSNQGITSLQYISQIDYDFDESEWEGNVAGVNDPEMSIWWGMRQTFNITDPSGEGKYLFAQFTTDMKGNWSTTDGVIFGVNYQRDWTYYRDDLNTDDCPNPCQTTVIVSLDEIESGQYPGTYTIIIESTLNGDPTEESFVFSMDALGIKSDKEVGIFCANYRAYKDNVIYPKFVHDDSRFYLSPESPTSVEDKARLKLSILVPRGLYDFNIAFDFRANELAGYDTSRVYDFSTDEDSETFWLDHGIVDSNNPCGEETWVAYIPWEVFGPDGGAGGVSLLHTWQNGSHTFVDDGTTMSYGSVIKFHGLEWVSQEQPNGREWIVEKDLTWRMPFVVRFHRLVYVETDIFVPVIPTESEFQIVAAITEKIQSETAYTLNTNQDYYAKFDFEIRTRVKYPHMLVSGAYADDPPNNWLTINTPHFYPDPLTADGHDFHPAQVIYTPLFPGLSVEAYLTFKRNESSCAYVNHNDINLNYQSVCEQYWNLEVIPSAASCFASGEYAVTWTVRCFHDKPTCYFTTDPVTDEIQNSVTVVFNIETTRICPVVVQNVRANGIICSTGRLRYFKCDDYTQIYEASQSGVILNGAVIDTYFQNDIAHFFMEVDSPDARIIYTRIYQIWASQNMSAMGGTSVMYDLSFEEVKLYDYHVPVVSHSFVDEESRTTATVPTVIEQTMNSNDFSDYGLSGFTDYGTGPTDEGLFSGFQVRLDPLLFPVLTDQLQDVTFTVILDIFYEGWGRQKTEGQDWDDNADPVGRRILKFDTRSRKQEIGEESEDRGAIRPSGEDQLTAFTSIGVRTNDPEFINCFDPNPGTDAWGLEMFFSQSKLTELQNTPETVQNEVTERLRYVLGAEPGQIEVKGINIIDNALRQTGSNVLMIFKVTDIAGKHTAASLHGYLQELTTNQLLYKGTFADTTLRRSTCIDISEENFDTSDFSACVFGRSCRLLGSNIQDYLNANEREGGNTYILSPNQLIDAQDASFSFTLFVSTILLFFLL